jgi:hypothetical protein
MTDTSATLCSFSCYVDGLLARWKWSSRLRLDEEGEP